MKEKIFNKKVFISMLLTLASASYSDALKYLEDGVDKTNAIKTEININLKDDFEKKKARSKENNGLRIVDREGLTPFTDKEYIGRTGIHFDFAKKEDDVKKVPEAVSGKTINIENGSIHAEGHAYSYDDSNRVGLIENSKINIVRNKLVPFYNSNNITNILEDQLRKPDPSNPSNYIELDAEDRRKIRKMASEEEKERPNASLSYSPIDVYNAKLIFKNSEIKIKNDFKADEEVPEIFSVEISNNFVLPLMSKGLNVSKNYAGLEFQRDIKSSSIYDLETEGDIKVSTIFEKNGKNLFANGATPLLKFGKNTRVKAGKFYATLDTDAFFKSIDPSAPDVEEILKRPLSPGTLNDEVIVFDKDSEVEFKSFEAISSNIIFKGGKLILKSKEDSSIKTTKNLIRGDLILDFKGTYWEEGKNTGNFGGRDPQTTDLTLLPESKVDVNFISHANESNNYENIEQSEEGLDTEKGDKFQLRFKENASLYVSQIVEADVIMDKGSHLYLSRSFDADKVVKNQDVEEWYEYNAAEFYGKEYGVDRLTFEEKYGNTDRVNNVQMRQKLFLNDTNIHFRTNIEKGLSDKLIVKNNVLSGEGTTTLHIKNQGGTETTGKEKINLIEAKKGVDPTLKFKLNNNIEVGGYEYTLDSETDGEGRTYFLIGEGLQNLEKEESGIKNNPKNFSFKKNLRRISPIKNSNLKMENDGVEIKANKNEYSINLENTESFVKNSEVLIKDGLGVKLEKSPLLIEDSNFYIDSKDTNSGLTIKAKENEKTLLNIKRSQKHTDPSARDLFINGRLEVSGNKNSTVPTVEIDKNSKVEVYNPKGNKALELKNASMKIENGGTLILEAQNALYSQNSDVSGELFLFAKGNLIHQGANGVNLALNKGSYVDAPAIQFDSSAKGSSLHFKDGTTLRLSKISNANLKMDKGSKLYLYSQEQANEMLFDDSLNSTDKTKKKNRNRGNAVTFSGRTELNDVDLYARINLLANTGDSIIIDGTNGFLTGKGVKLHLKNAGNMDVDNINRKIEFFKGKIDKNFKFNIVNELEIGSYIYDTFLDKTVDKNGLTRLTYILKEKNKRKAKLTSTAMGAIENIYSDYYTELSSVDGIFSGLNNMEFSKKNSVWARTDVTTATTKENFKTSGNSVYVGFDRQILNTESLHGGIFIGNTQTRKEYNKYSGKGNSLVFHGGLYLSYRGFVGDGDVILKYSRGKTDYNVLDTAGDRIFNKYDYSSKMVAFQFGRKLYPLMSEKIYIEPRIQASYGEIDGFTSKATNSLTTKVESIRTWSTGGDLKLGYKNNNFNTYIKAGISKEFLGDVDLKFNNRGVETRQLDEAVVTVGAGIEYNIGNHSLSLVAEKKESTLLKDYYRASLGYKFKF